MLRCEGGSSGLGCEIPLPMGTEMCVSEYSEQYRPKHVAVHYIVIKYTSCYTVVFDCIQFSKFHTHNGDDTLPRLQQQ